MENKYGYKVCYHEFGRLKLKIHLVTNSLRLAIWEVQYYENHKQQDRKTNKPIRDPTWFILPVKNYFEYKRLWKGCPF